MKSKDHYLAKNLTAKQIRTHGGIGHLNEGIEIMMNGIPTRLIAWPGNGYQTESIHVLTLKPGVTSSEYTYSISEEALLCVQGKGEVYLRERWIQLEPGDMAYFPESTPHSIRNSKDNADDFILVSSITPPLLSLYEESGFYIPSIGKIDFDAAEYAKWQITSGKIQPINRLRYNENYPELRAWNLSAEDVRRNGALFNVFRGAEFTANGSPMRFVLWPGHGSRLSGFHLTRCSNGGHFSAHVHPLSDECVIVWAGTGRGFIDGHWFEMGIHECVLAPCGVPHGGLVNSHINTLEIHTQTKPTLWGGFASPPQGDLYIRAGYVNNHLVADPPSIRFIDIEPIDD